MLINGREVTVEELVMEERPTDNMIKDVGNGMYLTPKQIEVLSKYDFNYQSYPNIKRLIFDIEDYLNDNGESDMEDLEWVAENLSDFNYYHNTNK